MRPGDAPRAHPLLARPSAERIEAGIHDTGPLYAETRGGRIPVEPWSTWTNLIFLAVVVYWAVKTRMSWRRHPLIVVSLPLILVGFIAGTVYHATRSHQVWLVMDYMPILILLAVFCYYLWRDLVGSPLIALGLVFLIFALVRTVMAVLFVTLSRSTAINIGYSLMTFTVVVPAVAHCRLRAPRAWPWLVAALAGFAVAVFFRAIDLGLAARLLPMGTHFLWHIFGGISTFFVLGYVYESDLARARRQTEAKEDDDADA